jgi:hypothetical protein
MIDVKFSKCLGLFVLCGFGTVLKAVVNIIIHWYCITVIC